jgi:arylsulfatase
MITRMTQYVGTELQMLDKLNLADNTLVVFSSDNGTTHLDLEVDYTFFKSVGELRGLKGSLYEGGVRVPTVVRWPGHVKAGTTSDYVSGFEDWLPTMMEVVDAKQGVPEHVDGVSLLPVLKGEDQAPRNFLYREFAGYGGQQTIRVGDWKAVRQNLNRGKIKTELYNIAADAGEQQDVAAQHPDVVRKLEDMMARQHVPSKLFPIRALDQ